MWFGEYSILNGKMSVLGKQSAYFRWCIWLFKLNRFQWLFLWLTLNSIYYLFCTTELKTAPKSPPCFVCYFVFGILVGVTQGLEVGSSGYGAVVDAGSSSIKPFFSKLLV